MKWLVTSLVLALAVAGATAAAAPSAGRTLAPPKTLASWPFVQPYGSFVESMARGPDGNLYVSRTTWGEKTNSGAILRIPVGGGPARSVVEGVNVGLGLLAGVAFDPQGRLYVALAAFSDDVRTGVFRVEANGTLDPVLYLPSDAFPNGLAFSNGYLYVTDPALGFVWRVLPGSAPVTQTTPWFRSDVLKPGETLGPDGIAFRGDTMYLTQYDRGQILTMPVAATGTHGQLRVLAQDEELRTADGIAFDAAGNLLVAVNGNGSTQHGLLVSVAPNGALTVLAGNPPWLDYPTQPVVVGSHLYVSNGSYGNGTPSVIGW